MPRASDKEMTEFGKKLDALLKQARMSDSELAKRMKIRQPNVYAMKYLTDLPQPRTLKKLATLFKVDLSFFYPNPDFGGLNMDAKGIRVYVIVEKAGKVLKKTRVI